VLGWAAVALAATNIGARRGRQRRRSIEAPVEPVITLDPLVPASVES